jgi:hypothetical protein
MTRKGIVLLMLAVSGPGCLSPGSKVETEARQTPPVRMAEAPPPPAVTVDQITDANGPQKAMELARELDFEDNARFGGPAMSMNGNTMSP